MLCAAVLLVRGAISFVARDWAAVNRLIGARSIEEEAADELASALQARAGAKR